MTRTDAEKSFDKKPPINFCGMPYDAVLQIAQAKRYDKDFPGGDNVSAAQRQLEKMHADIRAEAKRPSTTLDSKILDAGGKEKGKGSSSQTAKKHALKWYNQSQTEFQCICGEKFDTNKKVNAHIKAKN